MDLNDYVGDLDTDDVVADSGRPAPIPVGEYQIVLDEREFKEGESDDTVTVKFSGRFKVTEGQYEGRIIYYDFWVRHPNADAQRIGLSQLRGVSEAMGLDWAAVKADTSCMLDMPFIARVGLSKPRDGYEQRNELKSWKPIGHGVSAPPAGKVAPKAAPTKPTAGAKPATGGAAKSRPWDRKPAAEGASA